MRNETIMEENEEKRVKAAANKFKVFSIEPTSRKISLKKELDIISKEKVKALKEFKTKTMINNSKEIQGLQLTSQPVSESPSTRALTTKQSLKDVTAVVKRHSKIKRSTTLKNLKEDKLMIVDSEDEESDD